MQERSAERDEALVLRAQAGDGAATEELLRRYKNSVRARARHYFLEGGETDDLVQEGMIGLYAAIGAFREESGKSFKNFAYLCVTRRIYDAIRAAKRQKGAIEPEPFDPDSLPGGESPEKSLIEGENRAEFFLLLGRELSDFEFRIVTMYLEGMSYSEMCEATGKGVKSVDNALVRAKRKLLRAYGAQSAGKK